MSEVYVIRSSTGLVKIGVSGNVTNRIRDLQRAHGQPLEIVYRRLGDSQLERGLHAHYAAVRMLGEWFDDKDGRITETICDVADSICASNAFSASENPQPSIVMREVRKAAQDLINRYGTLRNAESASGIGYSMLSKLASGKRCNPTLATLNKLGLDI